MRFLGLEFSVRKAAVPVTDVSALSGRGWFPIIREPFSGAWQRGITKCSTDEMLSSSAIYACIALIAGDISKLRPKLMRREGGIWQETTSPAFSPVLRKPNSYQTRLQFFHAWMTSKLIHGNAFVLKERDNRGVVWRLHVLDPRLVKVKVTSDGGTYYELTTDHLGQVHENILVPGLEIIHDRGPCLYHPLLGVSPLYACALSATQGHKIQTQSAKFFENASRPSGMLSTDNDISDETADRLKREFESNFSSDNIGRLLVAGSGLRYEAMTIPPEQAQLAEQLDWTAADICRAMGIPGYKVGAGPAPNYGNAVQHDLDYFQHSLQHYIESIELLLEDGLSLPSDMSIEFDIDGLMRMDPLASAQALSEGIKAGWLAPNEARRRQGLPPVEGGDTPYLQQQNYSLEQLASRPSAPAAPAPSADAKDMAKLQYAIELLTKQFAESELRAQRLAGPQRWTTGVPAFVTKGDDS